MNEQYWIYALGFLGQGLFGARLIVQLLQSEREGKVVSPTVYWQLSLMASFLFLIYGIVRDDVVIIFGQTLSYYIYIRNLQLKKDWIKFHVVVRAGLLMLPFFAVAYIVVNGKTDMILNKNDLGHPVLIIGAIGQLMLNFRFVYQWFYSEREHESILPLGFWIISTVASVMVIVYAGFRSDPVLLVAQGLGIFVYIRNVIIHSKEKIENTNSSR